MKIIVIGAGIVGLTTSYWLARDGHEVTVIDRASDVAQGASFANGGQLSYDYVAPLAGPAVLRSLPRWLLADDSPVKFRPRIELAQLSWLAGFLAACTGRRSLTTTARLLALAQFSRQALDELLAREQLDFFHRRNGKIVFYATPESFASAVDQHRLQAGFGSRQQLLGRDDCIDLEPALAPAAARIQGAIYTPSEEVGDCRLLCEALQRLLESPAYDVTFRLGVAAQSLLGDGRRVAGVQIPGGALEAELCVLCAGSASRGLAQSIGLRLPLYPIRGYSISPRVTNAAAAPGKSITDHENRIVYAGLGDELRVAGFADIVGPGAPIDNSRVAALRAAVETQFPGACNLEELRPWGGDRPATPTGVPVIGRTHWHNLLVNVGHGALGFTLAAGSGRMIADMVAGRRAVLDERDFSLPALRRIRLWNEAAA